MAMDDRRQHLRRHRANLLGSRVLEWVVEYIDPGEAPLPRKPGVPGNAR